MNSLWQIHSAEDLTLYVIPLFLVFRDGLIKEPMLRTRQNFVGFRIRLFFNCSSGSLRFSLFNSSLTVMLIVVVGGPIEGKHSRSHCLLYLLIFSCDSLNLQSKICQVLHNYIHYLMFVNIFYSWIYKNVAEIYILTLNNN